LIDCHKKRGGRSKIGAAPGIRLAGEAWGAHRLRGFAEIGTGNYHVTPLKLKRDTAEEERDTYPNHFQLPGASVEILEPAVFHALDDA